MFQNIELFLKCELFFCVDVALALIFRLVIILHRTKRVRIFVLNSLSN